MISLAPFILLLILAGLGFQYGARYIYNYKISNVGIEIILFKKVLLKRIPFNDIAEIKKVSFGETLPFGSSSIVFSLRFGNRIWGEIVLVRLKKGMIKTIFVSPDNATKFIEEVLQKISKLNKR